MNENLIPEQDILDPEREAAAVSVYTDEFCRSCRAALEDYESGECYECRYETYLSRVAPR